MHHFFAGRSTSTRSTVLVCGTQLSTGYEKCCMTWVTKLPSKIGPRICPHFRPSGNRVILSTRPQRQCTKSHLRHHHLLDAETPGSGEVRHSYSWTNERRKTSASNEATARLDELGTCAQGYPRVKREKPKIQQRKALLEGAQEDR